MVREQILYNLNTLKFTLFYGAECGWRNGPCALEHGFGFWWQYPINVSYDKLVDKVQVFHTLTDFKLTCFIHHWESVKSPFIIADVSIFPHHLHTIHCIARCTAM